MPGFFSCLIRQLKRAAAGYDLQNAETQLRANNNGVVNIATSNDATSDMKNETQKQKVLGVSIIRATTNTQTNDPKLKLNYTSSVSSQQSQSTKSLATDMIQLTRFKSRRPTLLDERAQRKPSFRNMFLGVPEVKRRFSHDIRAESLAAPSVLASTQSVETKRVLLLQVFVPFLLSGFGNVGAGLLLNHAQSWPVFKESSMFYMLLATVMAFKSNLEATFAARLSTCSNLGTIKGAKKKFEAFVGNVALVQTQAVIFGLLAGLSTAVLRSIQAKSINWRLIGEVLATGVVAIVANELLSSVLILAVIVIAERARVNPDNVSTLLAAMWGDFSSVLFVAIVASGFHALDYSLRWIFPTLIILLLISAPLTSFAASRNAFTRNMFLPTHLPLAAAVLVATLSGLVFDHAIRTFARIAIYQAVINGVSVNLMAVQASRISTYLQQLNKIAPTRARAYATNRSPFKALYANDMNASVARWLIGMCMPALAIYLCFIFLVCSKDVVDITFYFLITCFGSILLQVTCVQCLTYLVTPLSWRKDCDPDNVVIPILMSISDCLGNAILLAAFFLLRYLNDPNSTPPH